jgi:hypothetical protein
VIRGIEVRRIVRPGSERDERVEDAEDEAGVDEAVVVELGQELDDRDPALVVLRLETIC